MIRRPPASRNETSPIARERRTLSAVARILAVAMLLSVPVEAMAADEGDPGSTTTTTTTTVPDDTTTTTTAVSGTTTSTVSDGSTTTTTADNTTTTIGDETTTTTVDPSTTTTTFPDGEEPTPWTGETGDPLDEGEAAEEDELLDPPRIYFPLVGASAYRDTFGAPRDGGARDHMGTDIFAQRGTPVVAVARGVVVRMGISEKAGLFVVVRHNDGWQSAYVHLNNDSPGTDNGLAMGFGPGIKVGARVQAGTLLGYVGDSGNSEENSPHLHFELHQPDRLKINPYGPLRASRRVRQAKPLPTVDYNAVVSQGAEMIAHLDPGSGFNADIASVDGHVYLGTWGNAQRCPGTGVRVIDVSSPSEPTAVTAFADHTEFPDTATSSLWVGNVDTSEYQGRVGIVGIERCGTGGPTNDPSGFVGVAIYDLTVPAEPEILSMVGSGLVTGGVADFDLSFTDDRILLAAAVPNSSRDTSGLLGAVRIVDISDPAQPRPLSDWHVPEEPTHPSRLPFEVELVHSNPTSGIAWVDPATLAVGRRYGGLLILDVSDPANPTLSSEVEVVSDHLVQGELTTQALGSNGRYLLINEVPIWAQTGGVLGRRLILASGDTSSEAVEIASPDVPVDAEFDPAMSGYLYPGGSTAHDPDLSVVAWMSGGVRVMDMADPTEPIVRGALIPAPAFDPQRWWLAPDGSDEFPMVWDVAENNGYFYASDHHSGLWVFTLGPLLSTPTDTSVPY